jgi:hypothetical protein
MRMEAQRQRGTHGVARLEPCVLRIAVVPRV